MVSSNNAQSILEKAGRIENLTGENFEKVYFILIDIKKQIQLSLSDSAKIYLVVPRELAKGYFVWDRNLWKKDIVEVLNYFKKLGIISEYTFPESEKYADVILNVDNFTKALKTAEKRNRLKYNRVIKFEALDPPSGKLVISYDSKTGLLGMGGDTVQLQKDAFNARMLGLILKTTSSRKKDWSWDEVVEAIEGVIPEENIREYKGKFYNACVGLKKTIASNAGVKDLLLYTRQSVRVNPKFI